MITLSTKLIPTAAVLIQEVDGEMVVLDMAQNRFAGLDAIGASIWRGLSQGKTPDEVVADLSARYSSVTREILESDVLRLARDFLSRGWMQLSCPSGS